MKTLKVLLLSLVAVAIMYATVNLRGGETVYERIENLEVETPVIEVPKWQTDEEAIKAAQDVIRKKELQAELADLKDLQASTTAKIKEVEKQLGIY